MTRRAVKRRRVMTKSFERSVSSDISLLVDVIRTGSSNFRADDWIRKSVDLLTGQTPFSVEPHRLRIEKQDNSNDSWFAENTFGIRDSRLPGTTNSRKIRNLCQNLKRNYRLDCHIFQKRSYKRLRHEFALL